MTAGQLHETLKQRILQLSDQDQMEILSNIEVLLCRSYYVLLFHALYLVLLDFCFTDLHT